MKPNGIKRTMAKHVGKTIVRVIGEFKNEVIRQIPSEKVSLLSAKSTVCKASF